jgi:hypothetical protein
MGCQLREVAQVNACYFPVRYLLLRIPAVDTSSAAR